MKNKKFSIIFATLFAIIAIPLVVHAQDPTSTTTSNSAQDPTGGLVIGTDGQSPSPTVSPTVSATAVPRKVNVTVTVTSSGNNRFLGGVAIKIDGADIGVTPDPPAPRGYTIPNVPAGKHEIIAERTLGNGYKIYDENITVPDSKSIYELSIKLVPAAGTYAVKDSDIRQTNQSGQYISNPQQMYNSQYTNQGNQYQNNPQYWNNGSSVYNPLTNYPNNQYTAQNNVNQYNANLGYNQQYGTSNQYNPFGNQQDMYNSPSYYDPNNQYNPFYNQQNLANNSPVVNQYPSSYYLTSNQANTVQFKITADTSKVTSTGNGTAEIKIYDAQNVNSYNVQSAIPYITSGDYGALYNRYGCLSPNRNYVLQIDIRRNDGTQFQPIQKGFTSPNTGDIVEIYVDWGAILAGNTNAIASRNTQLASNADPNFTTFRCPYSYYQNQNLNGPGIFSDPTINLQNMGNYQIARDYGNGNYYLANQNNSLDSRQMTFVDRGDGLGGLAFFSASPSSYYGLGVSSGGDLNFYVGLYSRSTNGELSITNNQFYQTGLAPSTYSNYVYGKNTQTFPSYYKLPQDTTNTTSKTPINVLPGTTTGVNAPTTEIDVIPGTTTGTGASQGSDIGKASEIISGNTTDTETLPQTTTGGNTLPQTTTDGNILPQTTTTSESTYSIPDPNPFQDTSSWYSNYV